MHARLLAAVEEKPVWAFAIDRRHAFSHLMVCTIILHNLKAQPSPLSTGGPSRDTGQWLDLLDPAYALRAARLSAVLSGHQRNRLDPIRHSTPPAINTGANPTRPESQTPISGMMNAPIFMIVV